MKSFIKKILLLLSVILTVIGLCACGGTNNVQEKTETVIDPAQLITAEDVTINAGYTPIVDEKSTGRDGNEAVVLYTSNPVGQNDVVKVKLIQSGTDMSAETVRQKFDADKEKRSSAEAVENLGEAAYIAFPTIHVYTNGCLIEITAGSGSDDTQKNMLKNFAITAVGRLETLLSGN